MAYKPEDFKPGTAWTWSDDPSYVWIVVSVNLETRTVSHKLVLPVRHHKGPYEESLDEWCSRGDEESNKWIRSPDYDDLELVAKSSPTIYRVSRLSLIED